MREKIYNFYCTLRQDELNKPDYIYICILKYATKLYPDMTLEEFCLMIKDFTKRFRREKEIN